MPILLDNGASTFEVSMNLTSWVANFISTLAGLFISLFLLISHDDLQSSFIEPVELSNNLNTVRKWFAHIDIVPSIRLLVFSSPLPVHVIRSTLVPDCILFIAIACIQRERVHAEGPQDVLHHEEGVSEGLRKDGESVQVQEHILRGAHCRVTCYDDTSTYWLHGESRMKQECWTVEHSVWCICKY